MSEKQDLIASAIGIFTKPVATFEGIKTSGGAWFPLVVVIVLSILVNFLYFQAVDFNWFIEQTVISESAGKSPAEQEMIRKNISSMGIGMMQGFSIGGAVIGLPIIYALVAALLIIISNIRNDNLTYGECFSLACWSGIIKSITLIFACIMIAASSEGKISASQISGLNLNLLFFGVDVSHPWYKWLSEFDLVNLWSAAVLGLGYKAFTKSSMTAAMIIGFLPTVLYFGIKAALI